MAQVCIFTSKMAQEEVCFALVSETEHQGSDHSSLEHNLPTSNVPILAFLVILISVL